MKKTTQPITVRARELREKQTPAENLLWKNVRNRKLGVKVVRQKPFVLDYYKKKVAFIADFYCHEARLVIEVDGTVHLKKSDYDSLRTMLLEQKGLRIIRFTNEMVLNDMVNVIAVLKKEIECGISAT